MGCFAAALLDVDGTLIDSNDQHAHSWVETFAEHDIEVTYDRVRQMIGMGGDRLIDEVTGFAKDDKRSKQIAKRRSELFRERWLPRIRALQGARELLLQLRDAKIEYTLATAAKADELDPMLDIAGIADLCTRRTTSSDVSESKPDPQIIDAALGRVAADRSQAVMVGDTPYDVEAAQRADVFVIGFTSGGWPRKALSGAIAVYDGPADLLAKWATSPFA